MFPNAKDQLLDQEYRTQKMVAAKQQRLAQYVHGNEYDHLELQHNGRRTLIMIASFIFLLLVTLFASTQTASAQSVVTRDPADNEPYKPAMLAYRLANYHAVAGDFERAIVEYERAIEGFPAELFAVDVSVAAIYWQLGDAQRLSGDTEAALVSYHLFLDLAGDKASEVAFERVAEWESELLARAESEETAG
ncbi:MAG: hypothetical protein KC519_08385 [Anaerolineae bacterium]|nr:hypothetical protein [Anaerolineae bacterium]